jgi:tRNA (guanine-N7-)-methyltransferase
MGGDSESEGTQVPETAQPMISDPGFAESSPEQRAFVQSSSADPAFVEPAFLESEFAEPPTERTATAYGEWSVTVRTFKPRSGRLSLTQREALQHDSGRYLLGDRGWELIHARAAGRPIVADIGFGYGESVLGYAQTDPTHFIVGFEIHLPGVGALCEALQRAQIEHVAVVQDDAQLFLTQEVPDGGLAGVRLFFPDPWPKQKHHKRRFIREHIVDLLTRKLEPGGFLHIATDIRDYADDALQVLREDGRWVIDDDLSRREHRPLTRFERRASAAGRPICDVIARTSSHGFTGTSTEGSGNDRD